MPGGGGSGAFAAEDVPLPFAANANLQTVAAIMPTAENLHVSLEAAVQSPVKGHILQSMRTQESISTTAEKVPSTNVALEATVQSPAKGPILQPMRTQESFSSPAEKVSTANAAAVQSLVKGPIIQPMSTQESVSTTAEKVSTMNIALAAAVQSPVKSPILQPVQSLVKAPILQPMRTQESISIRTIHTQPLSSNVSESALGGASGYVSRPSPEVHDLVTVRAHSPHLLSRHRTKVTEVEKPLVLVGDEVAAAKVTAAVAAAAVAPTLLQKLSSFVSTATKSLKRKSLTSASASVAVEVRDSQVELLQY